MKPAPMAILPPIPLYRRILRTHRQKLPRQERLLGDEYVKSEFRLHRNVENPLHIVCFTHESLVWLCHQYMYCPTEIINSFRWQIGFLSEWQLYAQQIEGDSWRGSKLDRAKLDNMSGMHESVLLV